jgi:hypothetical protein
MDKNHFSGGTMKAASNYQMCVQDGIATPMRNRLVRRFTVALFALIPVVPLCVAQEINSQAPSATKSEPSQVDQRNVIYVSDFDLDPANFKQDKGGITGKGYLLPAPPKASLRRKSQDRAEEARKLVRLMSESLVAELQKAGYTAQPLVSTEPRPREGWLVIGVFTELNEGNQMRRALIGFGSGMSKMDLYVMLADASSAGHSLYETSAQKSDGKMPGAVIALNPYAGAAGFVVKFGMTKNAPEKMVKQTASKIANELTKQLNAAPLLAAERGPNSH